MANSMVRRGSIQKAHPSSALGSTTKDISTSAFPRTNSYHSNSRNPNELVHAAEVLASFNQYPIRNTIFPRYTAQGLPPSAQPSQDVQQQQQQQYISDPLTQDIQSHSRDLVTTLVPILNTQEGDPGTKFDINNCKGVNHIAGAMMPPPDEEDLPKISSPTSRSALSPGLQGPFPSAEPTDQLPVQQQPQSDPPPSTDQELPQSPIKSEAPSFQTTFQFVVNENAKEARNTVRKHVMKEFRRRERWEQGQKGSAPSGVEKKPASSRKRRRRQATPLDTDQNTPVDSQAADHLDIVPPIDARSDPVGEGLEIANPVVELRKSNWDDICNSVTNRGSLTNTRAPSRKKNKVMTPPVFPESKQMQLWGAVSTEYNDAIMELESRSREPYRNDPWATVGVGQVDPFSKLNLDLGPATQSLLHHCMCLNMHFCVSNYGFSCMGDAFIDGFDSYRYVIACDVVFTNAVLGKTFHRLGWLYSAVAIHDPTPVHVILGYTLGHIASLRGLEEPPQALEHKSKAIKLLNHRMADPKQSYSDELIGAIVNFAGWEVKVRKQIV